MVSVPIAYHDFNNHWGSIICDSSPHNKPISNHLWAELSVSAGAVGRRDDEILQLYTENFQSFFDGFLPASFHGHVGDAISPQTVASMLMSMAIASLRHPSESLLTGKPGDRDAAMRLLGWSELHLDEPRWAVLEVSYGTRFGSLAHVNPHTCRRDIACGPRPVSIRIADVSEADLGRQLDAAKSIGCIGILIEIVANHLDGPALSPVNYALLGRMCAQKGLLFAVDETLTAIRCGAPFSFQREEYKSVSALIPDMVFFGKALVVRGSAVNFRGSFLGKLNVTRDLEQRRVVDNWQRSFTMPVIATILVHALGVLEQAKLENWAEKSVIIGAALREWLVEKAVEAMPQSTHGDIVLGGLASLIFIRKDINEKMLLMAAAPVNPNIQWVRLMPRLEDYMARKDSIESLLGAKSQIWRCKLSAHLMREGSGGPMWCFACGYRATTLDTWCRNCCIAACDLNECVRALTRHSCI